MLEGVLEHDYFRKANVRDAQLAEAMGGLRAKKQPDGTGCWRTPTPARFHLDLEDGDVKASHWNTLRALRVLNWHDRTAE